MKKHEDLIRGMLEQSRHPHRIAETLGVKVSDVRRIMRTLEDTPPGWGRLSLQPHIISRKNGEVGGWPETDAEILAQNRKLHDQGRVTMCQGRDGIYVIQYALPNNPPVKRDPYFNCGSF